MEHNRLYFASSLFMYAFIEHKKMYLTDTQVVRWLDNNICCLEPVELNMPPSFCLNTLCTNCELSSHQQRCVIFSLHTYESCANYSIDRAPRMCLFVLRNMGEEEKKTMMEHFERLSTNKMKLRFMKLSFCPDVLTNGLDARWV